MKILKFFVAVLLLPLCAGLAITLGELAMEFGSTASFWGQPLLFFGLGFGMWLAIFFLLPPPVKTYVLGHELTHALWALAMGGKVRGLRVGKKGGQVRSTVSNLWVTLAPYFFPIYMMAAALLFWLASLIWDATGWSWVLFYALGFTWSFHLTFTWLALAQPQTDVEAHGWLFSMVVIFCANILVALALLTLLEPHADWLKAGARLAGNAFGAYRSLFEWTAAGARQLTQR